MDLLKINISKLRFTSTYDGVGGLVDRKKSIEARYLLT